MAECIISGQTLDSIAVAVREKAGITNDMTPEEIIREVYLLETDTDTGAPSTGVIFYDYDGTILHQYTVKEARALTALPDGPTHDGLPFAGWTHSLEEVNATMKILHVGAMYEPETTKLTVQPPNNYTWAGYGAVTLYFSQTVSNGVTVNWGDGVTSTVTGTGQVSMSHQYSGDGEYTIEIIVTNGNLTIGRSDTLLFGTGDSNAFINGILTKVIVGAMNTKMDDYAFSHCRNIKSIVIPKGITKLGGQCFYDCMYLSTIIVPNSVTDIYEKVFYGCQNVTILILPENVDFYNIGRQGAFNGMSKIENIVLPSSVTKLPYNLFYYNYELKNIYFKSLNVPKVALMSPFNLPSTCTIYVPIQSLEQYKTTKYWSDIADQIKGMPVQYINT